MPSHRAPGPPSQLRRALGARRRGSLRTVRSVGPGLRFLLMPALLAVALVGLGTQLGPEDSAPHPNVATVLEVSGKQLSATLDRHQCSVQGFAPDERPRSALVRVDGEVQHVSFDEGWAVFTGDLPGELVAVCLASAPRRSG